MEHALKRTYGGKLDRILFSNYSPSLFYFSSSLGWKLDDAELQEAYRTLDQDKNGIVDFKEFVDCEFS